MIGIFLPPLDVSKLKYVLNFIKILDKAENQSKVIILVYKENISLLENEITYLPINSFDFNKYYSRILGYAGKIISPLSFREYEMAIKKFGIKFAIFPAPPADIINCKIPYATSIQSMGHRLNPELSETSQEGLWEGRENIISTLCKNAKILFIDSEIGKEYLKFYYNRKSEIIVLPHSLPDSLNITVTKDEQFAILNKFGISKRFLFYPAQLWPHKNHVRILEALRYLKEKGLDLQLVFTGSSNAIRKKYNVDLILKRIALDSKIEDDLIITGYVNDLEMKTLYLNALAMIMPQLIPEPCIPIVEAMGFNCPVITSNLQGLKEQVGDSGVLVDPYDVYSIANGINLLLDDQERGRFIKLGSNRYNSIKNELQLIFSDIEDNIISRLNFAKHD